MILIVGCASESMEFTTAKTALRSEKDLVRAETWFKKALSTDSLNALVPYIYATEILKPQKRYQEMSEMLMEAVKRNPLQKLETPFIWEEKPILTISDGSQAYREQEWTNIYNQGVDSFQQENTEKALELLEIAIIILPEEGNSYATLGAIYLNNKDFDNAGRILETGLKRSPNNIMVLQVSADHAIKTQNFTYAETILIKALNLSDDLGPILRQLIFVQIDLEKYESAIEYSMQAIRDYPNDPDIYYNVAVLYQKMGINKFDPAREQYLKISQMDEKDNIILRNIINNFKDSRNYFMESKDYFLTVTDLNPDDNVSLNAVKEIKKMLKQLDDIFIPSTREMLGE